MLITIEENAIGGFGTHVMQLLSREGALDGKLRMRALFLPDIFIDQDKPEAMYANAGLDSTRHCGRRIRGAGARSATADRRRARLSGR